MAAAVRCTEAAVQTAGTCGDRRGESSTVMDRTGKDTAEQSRSGGS